MQKWDQELFSNRGTLILYPAEMTEKEALMKAASIYKQPIVCPVYFPAYSISEVVVKAL